MLRLSGKGARSTFLDRIINDLKGEAVFEIVPVDYRFRNGGNQMLKITKKS